MSGSRATTTGRRRSDRARWLVLCSVAGLGACSGAPERRSSWPPEDFELEVRYSVLSGSRQQVRKSARIFADGLVVYREADSSRGTGDDGVELPVFRRMTAYRLHWRSIRQLARALHAAPVQELRESTTTPQQGERDVPVVRFRLTYMANHIHVVAQDQAVGLMNRVLRIVNAYLPEKGITMPNMAGEPIEKRIQDVPEVVDSVPGALAYHKKWLAAKPKDPTLLSDTFSLACTAGEWSFAESCIERIAALRPDDEDSLRRILRAARGRAGG